MAMLVIPSPLTAVGIESIVQVFPGSAHGKGFMDRALDNGLAFLRRVLDRDHQAYPQLSQEET
jgi:hypothetical protein